MASFERPNLMLRRGQASRSPISPKKQTWANLLVLSSLSVYAIFSALTVCQFKCWNFCTSVLGRSSRLSLSAAAEVSFVYKKALHGSSSFKVCVEAWNIIHSKTTRSCTVFHDQAHVRQGSRPCVGKLCSHLEHVELHSQHSYSSLITMEPLSGNYQL